MGIRTVKLDDVDILYEERSDSYIWLHIIEENEGGMAFYVTVAKTLAMAAASASLSGRIVHTERLLDTLAVLSEEVLATRGNGPVN